jgi:hypothetical protein
MGDQPCRKTQGNTNSEETKTDINASIGVRTHDPIVRALGRTATLIGGFVTNLLTLCFSEYRRGTSDPVSIFTLLCRPLMGRDISACILTAYGP